MSRPLNRHPSKPGVFVACLAIELHAGFAAHPDLEVQGLDGSDDPLVIRAVCSGCGAVLREDTYEAPFRPRPGFADEAADGGWQAFRDHLPERHPELIGYFSVATS